MANFKYRLQPVMRLREAARDERRARFAEALQAERILLDRIGEIETELQEVEAMTRQSSRPGELSVERLLQTHRYELVLMAQKAGLEQQRTQVAEEVERRRLALVEADRDVRVLEKLKEKKQADFQKQELKLEDKQLDEIAAGLRQRVKTREAN